MNILKWLTILTTPLVLAQSPPIAGIVESGLEAYIRLSARDYGVDEELAVCIARLESRFNPRALGDTHLTDPRTGNKIRSRGIWQINSEAWPDVSDETAFNFIKATEWAMPRLKETPEIWSTYTKCSNINP